MEKSMSLKGLRKGMKVTVGKPLPDVDRLVEALKKSEPLFAEGGLFFDFGDLQLTRSWILTLYTRLVAQLEWKVIGFSASDSDSAELLADMGLAGESNQMKLGERSTAILSRPLRSGQCFEHDGDVILVGNLHDGAEIQATGSVVVLGQLKGLVHAGCDGDESQTVVSMCYLANHIRIGDKLSVVKDESECSWWGKGVTIGLAGGVFVARELKLDK